jgi:phosphonate transport system substrate-binding protein
MHAIRDLSLLGTLLITPFLCACDSNTSGGTKDANRQAPTADAPAPHDHDHDHDHDRADTPGPAATPKPADTPAPGQTLSVGVVPQQSASKLVRLWTPILKYVGARAGVELRFQTAKDIPTFEQRCADGLYDLAYMNPYHYTVFHVSPGYIAIAKQEDKRIQGILVARKDSGLNDLTDLADQTLAFPAPAAFAASILTRAGLSKENVVFTPRYVSSHDSVYRGVAKGLYSAGGGIVRTFKNMDAEVADELRILWRSAKYTPHAFAVHPRLAPELRERISQALTGVDQSEAGRALLATINFKGVEAAKDEDWDDVRSLGLDLLERLRKG